jgi:uncharacterized protein YeaO (DUF488 family)
MRHEPEEDSRFKGMVEGGAMATGKASKGIRLKRAYEPPERGDGYRVLVDRLWPRGLKKNEAAIDEHLKEVAPSEALRKWFGHDPARWAEFRRRYERELDGKAAQVVYLGDKSERRAVTLLYAAKDPERNNAVVLKDYLLKARKRRPA